jgi:hypothetical protein
MPIIEGTTRLKTAVGEYDFAVDGGAISTITLRSGDSSGNTVPAGSVIVGGYVEVDTQLTSGGAATIGVNVEAAGDLLAAATAVATYTTGRKSLIPVGSGVTSVKTTVTRALTITVAAFALTAGKMRVVVMYR